MTKVEDIDLSNITDAEFIKQAKEKVGEIQKNDKKLLVVGGGGYNVKQTIDTWVEETKDLHDIYYNPSSKKYIKNGNTNPRMM